MIWAKEETMSRAEIEAVQLSRLKDTVNRVYGKVPAYRAKMEEAGVRPEHIQTLKDLQKLPFVTKQDMRDNYPYGLFAVPRKELRRIHASSGTTGKPTVVGYTENDLEKVGAAVVPSSTGNTQKQLMYMKDFETTLLVATPSYAMRIAEVALEMGINPRKDLKVKTLVLGSELMTEAMRNELYKVWGEDVNLTQNYGMSELMGPGVSGECLKLNGMHINEDHFIAEIIDSATGEVLPPGEKGELVITCISKEALPLIRYRTRDITRLMYEPCPCGRTTARMENLSGRTDDMLKIRGVNVFPSQIEEVLINTEGIGPNYEIVVDRKNHSDILIIKVEVEAESMMDSYAALERLENTLKDKMRLMLGLDAKIQLVSPNTLQRFEGKAKRVTDLRKEA